jgi:acetyl esterase/lipase
LLAEYDPLTPEGADYAKKLKSQGVPVELKIVQGRDHGFFTIPSKMFNDTVKYQEEAAAVIKKALA